MIEYDLSWYIVWWILTRIHMFFLFRKEAKNDLDASGAYFMIFVCSMIPVIGDCGIAIWYAELLYKAIWPTPEDE